MDVEDLIGTLRETHEHVLPFVGSGLATAAGAPREPALAQALAGLTAVPAKADATLAEVTLAAEAALGTLAVQERLAELITGWRLRPTAALTALCGVSRGKILTTNYDDGIERSAASRGLEPVPLLATDRRVLEDPGQGELQVIHLHGMPRDPASLVLPGSTTNALTDDPVFQTFMRATIAPAHVLYLGFSFGLAEIHLRALLAWLSRHVPDAREHYLLLSSEQLAARRGDMSLFASYGFVNVVDYEADPTHGAVERVAITLAPRSAPHWDGTAEWRTGTTWVQPIMVPSGAEDDREALQQRVTSFDYGSSAGQDVVGPLQVLEEPLAIVVAGPGMGKSTLLRWLPSMAGERLCARGRLSDYSPPGPGSSPEQSIARLLRRIESEERIAVEDLRRDDVVLLLDGLDEAPDEARDQAAAAIVAAAARWPGSGWVVTSRLTDSLDALSAAGFSAFHILPSRRWARTYLQTRSVPRARVGRAMLNGYGLGDLLGIPLFAERLANRLLDGIEESLSPLALLIEEQYATTQREARRQMHETADLGGWMRSLAVALELTGRPAASVDELTAVPAPGGLAGAEARRRLVDASLLVDVPGVAAFPLKTLQEGLCAHAILSEDDPVAALRRVAVASVAGRDRLRDDVEFTLDLVFEDADRGIRGQLRTIDPMRWARTVMTRGDLADAREAFEELWSWHDRHDLEFNTLAGSGLRTTGAAIAAIAARWPRIILERRDELESQAVGGSASARARAVAVLGELARDERTEEWLLPRLHDEAPRVVALAAQLAGRLRQSSAEPALRQLLDAPDEQVRKAALRALVEIVEVPTLSEIGALASARNDLGLVAERLLERLDLDTGIELIARSANVDGSVPWIIQRPVETAHADAWSPRRVATLMRACRQMPGGPTPDPELLADVFGRHPAAAIAAVHLQPIQGAPWGPGGQLLPLSRLDPALLEGDEHAALRRAIDRALAEVQEQQERAGRHERHLLHVQALLDERGVTLTPADLDAPYGSLRTLAPRYREMLGELLSRWWPATGLITANGEHRMSEDTRIMLLVGTEIAAPLTEEQWLELLDAHLGARRFGEHEISNDGVTAWLRATYTGNYEQHVSDRIITASDATAIGRLAFIAAGDELAQGLTEAMMERLKALDSESTGWLSAVGVMIEGGLIERARELLSTDIPASIAERVLELLARRGDADAQVHVVEHLTMLVEDGDSPARPLWHKKASTPEVVQAAALLADAAITRQVKDLPAFALDLIQRRPDEETLVQLESLAARHEVDQPWLALGVEQMARRIATRDVLSRLPKSLAQMAACFRG